MEDSTIFDYFVIGGGSGGIASARRAAAHHAKVGVAEGNRWGGTCVNVGCVPKKIMWWCANVSEMLKEIHHYGFEKGSEQTKVNWSEIKRRRDASVARLNNIYINNMKNANIAYFNDYAAFMGPRDSNGVYSLSVGSQVVKTKRVLIAVGGRPMKLNIPGEEFAIDSDGFFSLEQQPKKVAVLGAGYIAVELSEIFLALGSETHLFCRYERVLRSFDSMISETVSNNFVKHGGHLHPGSTAKCLQKDPATGQITVCFDNGSEHAGFDCVLVSIGRIPEIDKLNLESLQPHIEFSSKKSHLAVDEYQNTNVPQVYALGDVCGKVELTPMAIAAGRRLADRLFLVGYNKAKVSYECVPSVVFSHPPVASIGLTEEEAKDKFGEDDILIYKSVSVNLYYNVFDVPPEHKPRIYIKLVCSKSQDEKVLGLHMVGMGVDEAVQGFAVAMQMGARKSDFDRAVAVHPSMAEEVVTCHPWGLPHPDNDLCQIESICSDVTRDEDD